MQVSLERMGRLVSPRCIWLNGPVIIGAGPSGLAVGASLRELGVPFAVLEREDCIASLWQKRTYDSLKLKQSCNLPRMPFPADYPEYITRRQFIDYLETYAAAFDVKPLFNCTVQSARFDEICGLWRIQARVAETDGPAEYEYISRWLVVATGANAEPVVPDIPGLAGFCGEVTHSSDYSSGMSYIGKHVLVVGCGQSGMEVSVDLCNGGAVPFMVVRNVVGMATLYLTMLLMRWLLLSLVDKIMAFLAWLLLGDLARFGIRTPAVDSLTLKKTGDYGRAWCAIARRIFSGDITVVPSVARFTKSGAELSDGSVVDIDAVILATGYSSNVTRWLQGIKLLGKDGCPKTSFTDGWNGHSGLYSVGFTRRDLLGATADAVCVAKDLAKSWREQTKRRKDGNSCMTLRRCISVNF